MKTLSIVVPAYNEEASVEKFASTVFGLPLANPVEIVFVDDGSADGTLETVKRLAAKDSRVRYVSFSRNFGKEAALFAGLTRAKGELVATMDADLQHDPALLAQMAEAIERDGYDCAAACRTTRTGEPALRSYFAHLFY
ncbi:MAG: glycosyltransferase family 2 protein, partial [Kiritimatiellae bacterium]|nr:glycosyltransferase family 2 protein [Kiritimatiellia bacterium]